jgi:SAM-dependent methyltransferase
MRLNRLGEDWESLARDDPYWAVLSDPGKIGGGWETEEFFATGRAEVGELMQWVATLAPGLSRAAALDFGCGPGRLTLALGEQFEQATGVDVSPTMVELAGAAATAAGRGNVDYRVSGDPDLRQFADASFDLVYSRLVLQHIPPALSRGYVREFVRVLRPGGLAVFQVPSGFAGPAWRRSASAIRQAALYRLLRQRDNQARIRMYCVPRDEVESDLRGAGAVLLDARPDSTDARRTGWLYAARRDPAPG